MLSSSINNLPDIVEEKPRMALLRTSASGHDISEGRLALVEGGGGGVDASGVTSGSGKLKRNLSFRSKLKQMSSELFGSSGGSKKRSPSTPCLLITDDVIPELNEQMAAGSNSSISAAHQRSRSRSSSSSVSSAGAGSKSSPVSPVSPLGTGTSSGDRWRRLFTAKHSSLPESDLLKGAEPEADDDVITATPLSSSAETTPAQAPPRSSTSGIRRTHSLPNRIRRLSNPSSSSRQHIILRSRYQPEEFLYRKVLQSIQHPMGHVDTRPNFKPSALIEAVQKIFEVGQDIHDECLRDIINASPNKIVVSGCLLEANSLQPAPQNELRDTYCVIGLTGSSRTPFSSPQDSPQDSPKASPTRSISRKPSSDQLTIYKSKVIKHTLFPKWNELFELVVNDIDSDSLHIVVCDDTACGSDRGSTEMLEECHKTAAAGDRKTHGINRLVQHLKSMVDPEKCSSDIIGQLRIPLRDIPVGGFDQWFELNKGRKARKSSITGRIRLKLQLTARQQIDGVTDAGDLCNAEDFAAFLKRIYTHALKQQRQHLTSLPPPPLASLPEQSRLIMCQFATWNGLPTITQSVIELTVLLDMASVAGGDMNEHMLQAIVEKLDRDWLEDVTCKSTMSGFASSLSQFEVTAYRFIRHLIDGLSIMPTFPCLFPPCDLQLDTLNKCLGLAMSVINMPMWTTSQDARRLLSSFISHRLRDDAQRWMQGKLNSIRPEGRDAVLSECTQFVAILESTLNIIAPIFSVVEFFKRLAFDYYKQTLNAIESLLSMKARELMLRVDQYQLKYNRDHVNVRESSFVSNKVYCGLRAFLNVIKQSFTDKEAFRISMFKYQSWFRNSVIFWLQTYRDECIQRMQRALQLERDVVQVTSLVKYSESSVLVKSTFAKITKEWCDIDFNDADIALLGVTKITDTVCDGARQYADTVSCILEKKGYYDDSDNQQFDVTDQLCISLNNIENVRQYLVQLPRLLRYDDVIDQINEMHESTRVGEKARRTLEQLVNSADTDIIMRCRQIWANIIDMMFIDLKKYTLDFTRDAPNKRSSVDRIMQYLHDNVQVLCDKLEQTMVPLVLGQVWERTIWAIESTLLPGQLPEYYVIIEEHLQTIQGCMQRDNLPDDFLRTPAYISLVSVLQMNSLSTEELALNYYNTLAECEVTPFLSYGQLVIKTGVIEHATDGTMKLIVKVVRAQNLPAVNRKATCDPYVNVRLEPDIIFPLVRAQHTSVAKGSTNPHYHEVFEFLNLPKAAVMMEGAVLVCSVWHHDRILPNDFLGETVTRLSDVIDLDQRHISDTPAIIMPLRRPRDSCWGPMQVLRERQGMDQQARHVTARRCHMTGVNVTSKVCAPLTHVISKVKGKKEIVGTNRIMGMLDTPDEHFSTIEYFDGTLA